MAVMGRKSAAKEQRHTTSDSGKPPEKGAGGRSFLAALAVVLALGLGAYVVWGHGRTDAAADQAQAKDKLDTPDPAEVAKNEAFAKRMSELGPHKQASYPPIPYQEFAPPRPTETVNAAFQFAAEHPEVLSYIPCFCGCQQGGHRGNEDCFVRTRAQNGDVTEWEPHGVECAVCIDVATRARQMYASGASTSQIRAAVEKEFKPNFPTMTPTPQPPASH